MDFLHASDGLTGKYFRDNQKYSMKIKILLFFLISYLITYGNLFALQFDLAGKIESIRKGNILTILFTSQPDRETYLIINNDNIIGKLKILSINNYTSNQKVRYRALAEYFLNQENPGILKTGTLIGLIRVEGKEEKEG